MLVKNWIPIYNSGAFRFALLEFKCKTALRLTPSFINMNQIFNSSNDKATKNSTQI